MKTILEKTEDLKYIITQLQKIDSRLYAGQVISAWRENRKLLALFEKERDKLAAENKTVTLSENQGAYARYEKDTRSVAQVISCSGVPDMIKEDEKDSIKNK